MNDEPPYRVEAEPPRFRVVDGAGRPGVVCRDEASAAQYAVMLNEAWKAGYRTGFRDGRDA